MNTVEQALSDDLVRLLDRLAAAVPEHAVAQIGASSPAMRARLDHVEARLAATHAALVEDYARWTRTLDDLENLWALAAWRVEVDATDDVARAA